MPGLPSDSATLTALGVAAAVVVLGVFVYGFRDVRRFSLTRAWAVSGVTFSEGVRRRVLWVTPLAMLGVLALVRLVDPADEPDAIRQAAQSALFASGLVAIAVPLILSVTSLPREVESRTIFTVVTKPLSRLELLLGKLIGLARLSGLVLLIMGVFSYLLLIALDWRLTGGIEDRLGGALANEQRRPYLTHLADRGLLRADELAQAADFQVYGEPPADPSDDFAGPRWYLPTRYFAAVPFDVPPADATEVASLIQQGTGVRVRLKARPAWRLRPDVIVPPGGYPVGIQNLDNLPPVPPPLLKLDFRDPLLLEVLRLEEVADGTSLIAPLDPELPWDEVPGFTLDRRESLQAAMQMEFARVYVGVWGASRDYFIGAWSGMACVEVVDAEGRVLRRYEPAIDANAGPRGSILLRTYLGRGGLGLSGPDGDVPAPYGVLAFRGVDTPPPGRDGRVPVTFEAAVDRTGGVLDEGAVTRLEVQAVNADTGFEGRPQIVAPETGQGTVVHVEPDAVAGGDFDLRFRTLNRGQIVSLGADRVRVSVGGEPYALNLAKALASQWLLSILVAACGLAFSTFVGWPVALVLTLCVLGGRWVGDQLGTALGGDLGRGGRAADVQRRHGRRRRDAAGGRDGLQRAGRHLRHAHAVPAAAGAVRPGAADRAGARRSRGRGSPGRRA